MLMLKYRVHIYSEVQWCCYLTYNHQFLLLYTQYRVFWALLQDPPTPERKLSARPHGGFPAIHSLSERPDRALCSRVLRTRSGSGSGSGSAFILSENLLILLFYSIQSTPDMCPYRHPLSPFSQIAPISQQPQPVMRVTGFSDLDADSTQYQQQQYSCKLLD